MKKKQIISKLKFQKTTIVAFKTMKTIVGRSLVNTDTVPISRNNFTCGTVLECYTNDGKQSCISCTGTECTRPTTRTGGETDYCGGGADTKADCLISNPC
ncbi:MAG: hypothetical protein AB8B65_19820 [Kordia sp.]|uniref:hypothetical protein n=1 Tax=Kordia sp. TaxID=1965332 RepID=UPI00385AD31E